MGFEITSEHQDKMYAGQIITYIIRPVWNIPLNWVTEITHAQEPHYFIDEQRFGPYSFWHHEHRFHSIADGVEMIDLVYYKLPFGCLGRWLNSLKIKKDLEKIFSYRHAKIEEMFGTYSQKNERL